MDTLTESRAVLAPNRRVSSETLMTDSLTLEPPIVDACSSLTAAAPTVTTRRWRRRYRAAPPHHANRRGSCGSRGSQGLLTRAAPRGTQLFGEIAAAISARSSIRSL